MSGHSKWHSIKHKKGAADAKRGKIFTRHAKLITIAAQSGGDPDMNPRLRTEIERAKAAGVPNANIDRAVKKGTGELGGDQMVELTYEGYAAGGVAVLINVFTDNRNRTVQEIRLAFSKNGGQMADNGSVSYLFSKKGMILADISGKDAEEMEMLAIESGAEELDISDDKMEVITSVEDLQSTEQKLKDAGLQIESAELTQIASTMVDPGDSSKKVQNLLGALEELDDVDQVFCNADFPDEE